MSSLAHAGTASCPACGSAPHTAGLDPSRPARGAALRRFELSLPSIHCAACMTGVERTLAAEPSVAAARVNLTLRRVAVTAEDLPGAEARMIAALEARGFEARPLDSAALEATRSDAAGRALLARIGVAGFALMNVMLLSVSVWSGASESTRDLMHLISAMIALPAVGFAAQPFFSNAWKALRAGRLDMDVPISTAILLALGVSLWETLHSGAHAYFDAALMLTFFLLVGRYLAHLTRASARSAAAEIAALEVRTAERIGVDGARETVPLDALRPGDRLAVAPGAQVPADGVVISGRSEIDPALLTGETTPDAVGPGDRLSAGTTNLTGPLEMRAEALGDETLLKEIARLVEAAESSRSRYAGLADRASQFYSHAVNLLAVSALLVWGLVGGDWRQAVNVAAAVLIITCPCALGLAVPAVLTAASGRLFRQGVLLKDGDAFERLAGVDTVVFDKTGTLTTGRPVLEGAADLPREALAVAAGLCIGSAHPLAHAVVRAATDAGVAPAPVSDVSEHPGQGIEASIHGRRARFGRADWVGATDATGPTTAWLALDEAAPLAFAFSDQPRAEARDTIARLTRAGLTVELLSGDAETPVRATAETLRIDTWTARATPQAKVAHLDRLRDAGRAVLMVGDGLNDAAPLAAAHVSISPSSAVDASRNAADLILLANRLDRIPGAIALARVAHRRILENFGLAFAYNVITVPIAYAGLVTPLIAAIAMSASSVVVGLNAMRLGRA